MRESSLTRARRRADLVDARFATPTRLADRPRLSVVDGFLDDGEVAHFRGLLDRAGADPSTTPTALVEQGRLSVEVESTDDAVAAAVIARLRALLDIEPVASPWLFLRRYGPGGRQGLHHDRRRPDSPDPGELVLSAMCHLEDACVGGTTTFPLARPAPLRIPPVTGRLVFWTNHLAGGAPDPLALHEADLVRAGVKSIANWFAYADPTTCALLPEARAGSNAPVLVHGGVHGDQPGPATGTAGCATAASRLR